VLHSVPQAAGYFDDICWYPAAEMNYFAGEFTDQQGILISKFP